MSKLYFFQAIIHSSRKQRIPAVVMSDIIKNDNIMGASDSSEQNRTEKVIVN